ncbi:hypothetical protein LUZ60_011851 [Juncus effusus]|nr:hypothetical protein LUZ60_011851 [Juncus effusus]
MRSIAVRPFFPAKNLPSRRINYRLSFFPSMASNNKEGNEEIQKLDPEKEKIIQPALEPPEKPLAGDCCGSGCVRCVWDVYYEELEDYNKKLALLSPSDSDRSAKTSSRNL